MATERRQINVRVDEETAGLVRALIEDMSQAAGCEVKTTAVIKAAVHALAEKRGLVGQPAKLAGAKPEPSEEKPKKRRGNTK
jgi:hypothetical protein